MGMKRVYVILALLAFSLAGMAQEQKKWKAPKRPKRPKWEAPRQVAPEVIDVWRPYNASDNWMLDFYGGWSMSMAENMSGHGIAKMGMPMFDLGIGKQFSKICMDLTHILVLAGDATSGIFSVVLMYLRISL